MRFDSIDIRLLPLLSYPRAYFHTFRHKDRMQASNPGVLIPFFHLAVPVLALCPRQQPCSLLPALAPRPTVLHEQSYHSTRNVCGRFQHPFSISVNHRTFTNPVPKITPPPALSTPHIHSPPHFLPTAAPLASSMAPPTPIPA